MIGAGRPHGVVAPSFVSGGSGFAALLDAYISGGSAGNMCPILPMTSRPSRSTCGPRRQGFLCRSSACVERPRRVRIAPRVTEIGRSSIILRFEHRKEKNNSQLAVPQDGAAWRLNSGAVSGAGAFSKCGGSGHHNDDVGAVETFPDEHCCTGAGSHA